MRLGAHDTGKPVPSAPRWHSGRYGDANGRIRTGSAVAPAAPADADHRAARGFAHRPVDVRKVLVGVLHADAAFRSSDPRLLAGLERSLPKLRVRGGRTREHESVRKRRDANSDGLRTDGSNEDGKRRWFGCRRPGSDREHRADGHGHGPDDGVRQAASPHRAENPCRQANIPGALASSRKGARRVEARANASIDAGSAEPIADEPFESRVLRDPVTGAVERDHEVARTAPY